MSGTNVPYAPPVLTQEQAAEFPGTDLGGFALAWIAFRRSSPCTARRTLYPYFTAPKPEEVDENDVLFGPDREEAYRRLMWQFRKCQRGRLFQRYFDDAHNAYYKSETIPGLVLLKQWSEEIPMGTGVATAQIRSVRQENYDLVYDCVESLPKSLPKDFLGNRVHAPVLAPSRGLLEKVRSLKDAGSWNEQAFYQVFAPAYLTELLAPEPYALLREIADGAETKSIVLACSCGNGLLCRREILRRAIEQIRASKRENAENIEKEGASDGAA